MPSWPPSQSLSRSFQSLSRSFQSPRAPSCPCGLLPSPPAPSPSWLPEEPSPSCSLPPRSRWGCPRRARLSCCRCFLRRCRRRSDQLHVAHACLQARYRCHHQVDRVGERGHLRVGRRRSVAVGHEARRRVPGCLAGCHRLLHRRVSHCRIRRARCRCLRRRHRCRSRRRGRVRRRGSRLQGSRRSRRGNRRWALRACCYTKRRSGSPRNCVRSDITKLCLNLRQITPLYDHHATCLLVSPARRGWSTRCRLRQSPSGRQWTTQSTAPV
jgi:hypothetical protein